MSLTVFLLDYERFSNILNFIFPHLLTVECVSQIIICHANYSYSGQNTEIFPDLSSNQIQIQTVQGKQVVRIQDANLNDTYCCFRRWIWIQRLVEKGILTNSDILTHDDDFCFYPGQIEKCYGRWKSSDAICFCAAGGRLFEGSYQIKEVNDYCPIVVGQSIFIRTSSVLEALRLVDEYHIPIEILQEDDIVISLLLSKGENRHYGMIMRKKLLPSPNARWRRDNHLQIRTDAANWILNRIRDASSVPNCPPHSHFLSTTGDKQQTLLTTETPSLTQ